jgi:hypothetical protein
MSRCCWLRLLKEDPIQYELAQHKYQPSDSTARNSAGLTAVILGLISLQKQKAGEPRPYISEGVKTGLIAVLVLGGVLLGFAIAKNV